MFTAWARYSSLFVGLFVILLFLFSRVLPISPQVTALAASFVIAILPLEMGRLLCGLLCGSPVGLSDGAHNCIIRFTYWLIGCLILLLAILVLGNSGILRLDILLVILAIVITLPNVYSLIRGKRTNASEDQNVGIRYEAIIFPVMVAVGVVSFLQVISKQPFPLVALPRNEFIYKAISLMDAGIVYADLGFPPLIPTFLGISAELGAVHPILIMRYAPLLVHITLVVGVYFLTYRLLGSQYPALLAAVLGPWTLGSGNLYNFDHVSLFMVSVVFSMLIVDSVTSNSLTTLKDVGCIGALGLVVPFVLLLSPLLWPAFVIINTVWILATVVTVLTGVIAIRRSNGGLMVISLLWFVSFVHRFQVFLLWFLLVAYMIGKVLCSKRNGRLLISIFLAGVSAFIVAYIAWPQLLPIENPISSMLGIEHLAQVFSANRLKVLINDAPAILLMLSIFGGMLALYKADQRLTPVVASFGTVLLLFFLPEVEFRRFDQVLYVLILILSAYSVKELLSTNLVSAKWKSKKTSMKMAIPRSVSLQAIFLVALILVPTVVVARIQGRIWQERNNPEGHYSITLSYEIEAAMWIRNNLPKNWVVPRWFTGYIDPGPRPRTVWWQGFEVKFPATHDTLLVSDPYTMLILSHYSGRDAILEERRWILDGEYSAKAMSEMSVLKQMVFKAIPTEEINPTVIVEDGQKTFWTSQGIETGSLAPPTIYDETETVKSGKDSGKIVVGTGGTYGRWRLRHNFSPAEDFSGSELISLWWYGSNTGLTHTEFLVLLTSPENYYVWSIKENWEGWRRLVFSLKSPERTVGSPNLTRITDIMITGKSAGTWYLDRVVLDRVTLAEISHRQLRQMFLYYDRIIVVVSERTSTWVNTDDAMFIWWTKPGVNAELLALFSDSSFFKLIFSVSDKLYMFEVQRLGEFGRG